MDKTIVPMIEAGKVTAICDGQFGSTGKGLIAAYMGETQTIDIATTNASANAGHTACWEDGRKIVCCHLPMAGVVNKDSLIYINAGAIIDVDQLLLEIADNNVGDRLLIHPRAAVIRSVDIAQEKSPMSSTAKISSTQKGVGAALAGKVARSSITASDIDALYPYTARLDLNQKLWKGARVLMEVPQGYSLGYHSMFYPYCTSRQCTPAQGMADAQIDPRFLGYTLMTLRTYPIRVGSLPGGYSGGWYPDQEELSWESLGIIPEKTTVTQRERRVASFSWVQYQEAVSELRPDFIFANFMNYLTPSAIDPFRNRLYEEYQKVMGIRYNPYIMYGFGPNVEDVRTRL